MFVNNFDDVNEAIFKDEQSLAYLQSFYHFFRSILIYSSFVAIILFIQYFYENNDSVSKSNFWINNTLDVGTMVSLSLYIIQYLRYPFMASNEMNEHLKQIALAQTNLFQAIKACPITQEKEKEAEVVVKDIAELIAEANNL